MTTVVIGAGIIGLAVARQLLVQTPSTQVTVLEKEDRVAAHQTGHNSGVVHAGIYYPPTSLKAALCRRGRELLAEFCAEYEVPIARVGKLVVASHVGEVDGLRRIQERALASGVADVRWLDAADLTEIEPAVQGVAGLHSPSTGIVDFAAVARALAADVRRRGGVIRLSARVSGLDQDGSGVSVRVAGSEPATVRADRLIVCAGLQSAQVASLAEQSQDPLIVPFRGEYYRLATPVADSVRGLIYPVPDPRFPFLGIHLTRRIDGTVDAGPNAVLAGALEGYRRGDISPTHLWQIMRWPGFRRIARKYWRTGLTEMYGSLSKRHFAAQAAKYLPGLTSGDLTRAPSGVRAQAISRDGELVDDFWISQRGVITLVRNAPSPGATSSLAIAEYIVEMSRT